MNQFKPGHELSKGGGGKKVVGNETGCTVTFQHNRMICRCLNTAALAILLPVIFKKKSMSKVCANIYISHQCLSNEQSESGRAVPSSCQ